MAIDAVLVGQASSSGSSATTASGSTTTGSTFLIAISYDAGVTISSVSDNKGNTYTLANTAHAGGSGHSKAIYYKESGTGGAGHTATVNFSGAFFGTVYLIECTGADVASFDQSAQGTPSVSPYSVSTSTLAQADEVIVSIFGTGSSGPTYASSNTTVLGSEPDGVSYWTSCVSKQVVASTTAFAPSFTETSGNNDTGLVVVAIKQGTAAPPAGPGLGFISRRGPGVSPNKTIQFQRAPRAINVLMATAMSGQSASFSQGTVTAAITFPALGSITPPGPGFGPFNNSQFVGAPRGFSQASSNITVLLTGQIGTLSQGALINSFGPALSGTDLVSSIGSLATSASVLITNNLGTFSLGTISTGNDATAALVGQILTANQGNIIAVNASVLSGSSSTSTAGNLGKPALTVPLISGRVQVLSGVMAATGGVLQGLPDNGDYDKTPIYLVSPSGKTRWVDYIPIKEIIVTPSEVDRFDDLGALSVKELSNVTGLTPWVDYKPCALVSDPDSGEWRFDDTGYIPVVKIV